MDRDEILDEIRDYIMTVQVGKDVTAEQIRDAVYEIMRRGEIVP